MAMESSFFILDDGFKVAVAANLLRLFLRVVVGHGVLLSVAGVLTDRLDFFYFIEVFFNLA